MSIDDLLDTLDCMVDKAVGFPLSGGRCVMNGEKIREIIDDIRLNIPQEIRQAKAIVADRSEIIKTARQEAAGILKTAEDKAKSLVTQDEVYRQAQTQAATMVADAQAQARDIKKAATEYADSLLQQTESNISGALSDVKHARQALRAPSRHHEQAPETEARKK